jgi:hypothetical protein
VAAAVPGRAAEPTGRGLPSALADMTVKNFSTYVLLFYGFLMRQNRVGKFQKAFTAF